MRELGGKSTRNAPGFIPAAFYGAAGVELAYGAWLGFGVFLVLAVGLTALGTWADRAP